MKKRVVLVAVAAVLTVLLGASVAALAQTAVTECGQIVSGDAYLTGDLDCTGFHGGVGDTGTAIALGRRGRLDLRGFTLTAGESGVGCVEPCKHNSEQACTVPRCEIFDSVGGGVVTGAENSGIHGDRIDVRDITVSNHGDRGIDGYHQVRAYNVTVFGNDAGVIGRKVKVYASTITGNFQGFAGGRRLRVYDSVVSDNQEHGVAGQNVYLRNTEVTGNGSDGVVGFKYFDRGGRVRALDSVIVDNCVTDTTACVDVRGEGSVRLRRTTVGTCSPWSACH